MNAVAPFKDRSTTKQLYCDIKLKQEPGTALSLTKNGLSAD